MNLLFGPFGKVRAVRKSVFNFCRPHAKSSHDTAIFLTPIHFFKSKKANFVPRVRNSTTHLTQVHSSSQQRLESVNLQYNTLGRWDKQLIDQALMFQVFFNFHNFLQNSLQKSFQFNFFITLQK